GKGRRLPYCCCGSKHPDRQQRAQAPTGSNRRERKRPKGEYDYEEASPAAHGGHHSGRSDRAERLRRKRRRSRGIGELAVRDLRRGRRRHGRPRRGGSGRGLSQCHGPLPRLGQLRRLLDAFSDKYDIEINNDTSTGASQDLINAVKNRQGQETSLDYLDTGESFAVDADEEGLLAEYHPATADDLPDNMKSKDGRSEEH